MAVAAEEFFGHTEKYLDYRKVVYERSDQTLKSNRTDLKLLVTFKSVYMVSNLIKSRSLPMVRVHQQKPGERDRDGTRNTYNTSV